MRNEQIYLNLIENILANGKDRNETRNHPAIALFGQHLKFNVSNQCFLLTKRKMFPKGIIGEVISFIDGATNISEFKSNGCNYWDKWADKNGDLGPIYGSQWRNFNNDNVDQFQAVISDSMFSPQSRRLFVTAWNPSKTKQMALPPCFHSFQLFIDDGYLDLLVNMRSCDVMVGLPSDVFFHNVLMCVLCEELKLKPRYLNMMIGDCHIYNNHIPLLSKFISQAPYSQPKLTIKDYQGFNNLTQSNFVISNYKHSDPISFPVNE